MSIRTIIENIKSKGLLQAMGLLDQLYQKAIESEEKLAAAEVKCAALAADNAMLKAFINRSCCVYDGDGSDISDSYLPAHESPMMPDVTMIDAFLAEVRAQGVAMVIAYHHERSDALAEVDRNSSFRHHSAAIDATDVLMKIRQEAAQ